MNKTIMNKTISPPIINIDSNLDPESDSDSYYSVEEGSDELLDIEFNIELNDSDSGRVNHSIHLNIDSKFVAFVEALPKEIQQKICILAHRNFWKNFVPITAQVPSWYTRKVKTDKILYQARLKNIHFLHLPFNTLPLNKKWIMGCQCEYCLKVYKKDKNKEYKKQYLNSNYFENTMPYSTESYWNKEWHHHGSYLHYIYDPLHSSIFEDYTKWAVRTNEELLQFSDDIMESIHLNE